jgi:hypothetical protein
VREIDPGAQHADLYNNDFTAEQNQQFTAQFGEITVAMAACLDEGQATDSPSVQELIGRHYEFVSQFWKPNRESYVSLAMSYILPSPYRDSYESVRVGLGKFHYDAIVAWSNANLD